VSVCDRVHIGWRNDLVNYVLAADATVETAYPLTNCLNTDSNRPTVFDMTGEVSVVITFSGSTAQVANCFSAHNHDAPSGTTCRLELYDGVSQSGTKTYDSNNHAVYGVTDMHHKIPLGSLIAGAEGIEERQETKGRLKWHYSQIFGAVQYKSGRITIANSAGFTNNALKIDKLHLGPAYMARINPQWGIEYSEDDDSKHRRKPAGGMDTIEGVIRRTMRMDFSHLENYERETMRRILNQAGFSGDLLIFIDPNDSMGWSYQTASIYRRMSQNSFIGKFYNGNDFALALEEN
jgi:hypothetical protein